MTPLAPLGRLLFSAMFIMSGLNHLQNREAMAGYAASSGLPFPEFAVVASGIVILVGGVLVLLGLFTRFGALLLAAFLFASAFTMHAFWAVEDPQMAQMQMSQFMKNVSMAGGALLLMYFGPGPISLTRVRRASDGRDEVRVPLRERYNEP